LLKNTVKKTRRECVRLINLAVAFVWQFGLAAPSNHPKLLRALEDIQERTHLRE
jgi:hypothetical protein